MELHFLHVCFLFDIIQFLCYLEKILDPVLSLPVGSCQFVSFFSSNAKTFHVVFELLLLNCLLMHLHHPCSAFCFKFLPQINLFFIPFFAPKPVKMKQAEI